MASNTVVSFYPMEEIGFGGASQPAAVKPISDVYSGFTFFRDGDIVVAKITPSFENGKGNLMVGLVSGLGFGTTELHVLRPHSVHGPYLDWLVQSKDLRDGGAVEMTGAAGQQRVPDWYFRDFEVPIADTCRQRAIADFLDRETGRIDALVEKKRRLTELLEEKLWSERTRAVLGTAESRGIQHPKLGVVAQDRQLRRLRYVVPRIGVGVVVNPSSYFAEVGVPFIHGSDVRDGWIDTSDVKRMSEDNSGLLWRSQLDEGDVVVVRAGYPGRAAVIPPTLAGANCASILILKRSSQVRPDFLAAFFNSAAARRQIEAVQYGAAQEQVNVGHVVDFVIPIPPLDVQDQVLYELEQREDRIRGAVAAIQRQRELLAEYRQALITAAVTGGIDVGDHTPSSPEVTPG